MKKLKEKLLNNGEFEKTYKNGEKIVIFNTTPFSAIGNQLRIKRWLTHWNQPIKSGVAKGTAYACCIRNSSGPIKIYSYYLNHNADGSGTILDIRPHLPYHYVSEISIVPPYLKNSIQPLLDEIKNNQNFSNRDGSFGKPQNGRNLP